MGKHLKNETGHGHDGHGHSHAHVHGMDSFQHLNRAFVLGITLNLVYVAVELSAGFILDSVSLISDAGHNFSDVISLVLAMIAFKLAQVRPSANYTYGYKKSTILVSLLNALILLAAIGFIVWESIEKLKEPQPLQGGTIAWVAGVGIVINAFTAWLFMKDRKRDLNVQGAFLHMAADTLVSVGVVISGIVISVTGWNIIDPIIGLVIAAVILFSTIHLLTDSLRLSLDGVPRGIVPSQVKERVIEAEPSVKDMHHIHIWAISTTQNALTAHVVVAPGTDLGAVKMSVKKRLADMGITHSTLEFEYPDEGCCTEDDYAGD